MDLLPIDLNHLNIQAAENFLIENSLPLGET